MFLLGIGSKLKTKARFIKMLKILAIWYIQHTYDDCKI